MLWPTPVKKERFSPISNPVKAYKMSGSWPAQSKVLKTRYLQLTNEDLSFEAGKEEELFGRLAARLKKTRDEVIAIIKSAKP